MKTTRTSRPENVRRKILLVDDHPIMRYGLVQLISNEPDLEVCGEMNDAQNVLTAVQDKHPDLVMVDLSLPGKGGTSLVRELRSFCPELAILIVSMHDETAYAERALRAGANGYIMKSAGGQRVLEAVRRVLDGGTYLSDAMSGQAVAAFAGRRGGTEISTLASLTEREFQVFELIAQAMTTKEMAAALHISPKTIETHRMHIVEKLGSGCASELTKFAIRWARAQELP